MSNPEWGRKHLCQQCGSRFYDMGNSPPTCPKCGGEVAGPGAARTARGRAAAESRAARPADDTVEAPAAGIDSGIDEPLEDDIGIDDSGDEDDLPA